MTRLFGTDGVRGVANHDLTPDLALALGRAAGRVLAPGGEVFLVGRDTRVSGPMLEAALVAGLCSAGVQVRTLGIIPSPGVAWLTVDQGAAAGAVISASHNPVPDNGIKFFSSTGSKTSAATEADIESLVEDPPEDLPVGGEVGSAAALDAASDRYVDHLIAALEEPLSGLRVVLDCAYGAAYSVAPRAFKEAGADVQVLHAEPDGTRINVDCGSTNLSALSRKVVEAGADIGLAFDGDADRVLAVDERGHEVNGDKLIVLSALHLLEEDALKNNVVVTTVMANLGMVRALEDRGIEVVTTPVGDKHVAEAMAETGSVLGGEQSGHVIFGRHATTGDGILTGLQIASLVEASDQTLSGLAEIFSPYPQVLINVPVKDRGALEGAEAVWAEVSAAEERLGTDGRVLLRASGTEPLVRVMVEAADEEVATSTAEGLAGRVRELLG